MQFIVVITDENSYSDFQPFVFITHSNIETPTSALYSVVSGLVHAECKLYKETGHFSIYNELPSCSYYDIFLDNNNQVKPEYTIANKIVEILQREKVQIQIAPIISNTETLVLQGNSLVKPSVFVNG